jgi:AAA+ ATPase superfamily predicted ATPase
MTAIQEEQSPLYGRFELSLRLDPFEPHEAARMLPKLRPAERALVWGLAGGVPLYLEWWNQSATVAKNLESLVCTPGGQLLNEGDFVLATEGGGGDLHRQILYAIGAGRTRYNEIEQAVGTNPSRVLDNLVELRLIERIAPITEVSGRTRRKSYKIADNFLAFWLGIVSRYRAEIDRGLGRSILPTLFSDLDDHMGPRWENAFRHHLRRLAARREFGKGVVAVGPYWSHGERSIEIDAVVLAGRSRKAILLGEAKWSKTVNGERIRKSLEERARHLPAAADDLLYAVCAREKVTSSRGLRAVTARHIFSR